MKNTMTKKEMFQAAFLLACLLLSALGVIASPPGGGGGAGAPIDGGITLLLGAGASYGIKKLRDKRKS